MAIDWSYSPVRWQNKPSIATPLNATNLNIMDNGILNIYGYLSNTINAPLTDESYDFLVKNSLHALYDADGNKIHETASSIKKNVGYESGRKNLTTVGTGSTALGDSNTVSGDYSIAVGWNNEVSGQYASAFGEGLKASAMDSFVIGRFNKEDTKETYAFIVGSGTGISSDSRKNIFTVDWDGNTNINGDILICGDTNIKGCLIVDGGTGGSEITGDLTVIGDIEASNFSGIVDSCNSTDTNKALSANQGKNLNDSITKIKENVGYLIGRKVDSTKGVSSTTLGYNNTASGAYSVAIGNETTASGQQSFSAGIGTQATGTSQFVVGRYNKADTSKAFIIGGGSSASSLKNIMEVSWAGAVDFSGTVTANGLNATTIEATGTMKSPLIDATTGYGFGDNGISPTRMSSYEIETDVGSSGTIQKTTVVGINAGLHIDGAIEASNFKGLAANLTTTNTGMALDATMGKNLQDQISTLNSNKVFQIHATEWIAIITNMEEADNYYHINGAINVNIPGDYGFILCLMMGNNGIQFLHKVYTGELYVRSNYFNLGTGIICWTDWKKLI